MRIILRHFFIFTLSWTRIFVCFAQETPVPGSMNICNNKSIIKIDRPILPNEFNSSTFSYSYQIARLSKPGSPTIIFLPGGPGASSINTSDAALNQKFPDDFGIILTDPRGVGCNSNGWRSFPNEFYSTENFASDILAIIEKQGLDNYYIYGTSYGTVLATIVAQKIWQKHLVPPKAVVLEGTLGKFFEAGQDLLEFINQWKRVQVELPKSTLEKLREKNLPFFLTSEKWAGYIENNLTVGNIPFLGDWIVSQLSALDSSVPQVKRDELQKLVLAEITKPIPADFERLYRLVSCQELTN